MHFHYRLDAAGVPNETAKSRSICRAHPTVSTDEGQHAVFSQLADTGFYEPDVKVASPEHCRVAAAVEFEHAARQVVVADIGRVADDEVRFSVGRRTQEVVVHGHPLPSNRSRLPTGNPGPHQLLCDRLASLSCRAFVQLVGSQGCADLAKWPPM